jgi:hypothetical protein
LHQKDCGIDCKSHVPRKSPNGGSVAQIGEYKQQTDDQKRDAKLVNQALWQMPKFRQQNRDSKELSLSSFNLIDSYVTSSRTP